MNKINLLWNEFKLFNKHFRFPFNLIKVDWLIHKYIYFFLKILIRNELFPISLNEPKKKYNVFLINFIC